MAGGVTGGSLCSGGLTSLRYLRQARLRFALSGKQDPASRFEASGRDFVLT